MKAAGFRLAQPRTAATSAGIFRIVPNHACGGRRRAHGCLPACAACRVPPRAAAGRSAAGAALVMAWTVPRPLASTHSRSVSPVPGRTTRGWKTQRPVERLRCSMKRPSLRKARKRASGPAGGVLSGAASAMRPPSRPAARGGRSLPGAARSGKPALPQGCLRRPPGRPRRRLVSCGPIHGIGPFGAPPQTPPPIRPLSPGCRARAPCSRRGCAAGRTSPGRRTGTGR